jgi:hypothetical protein
MLAPRPSPTPRRRVAPPTGYPPLPAVSPIKGHPIAVAPPFSFPSRPPLPACTRALRHPPPLFPWPHVRAGRPNYCRCAIFTPPRHSPPSPCPLGELCPLPSLPLLDHASPPLSPPPAAGLIDTLPGHRSSTTALERRPSLVRTPPPHLARRNRCRSPVESPLGALHLGRRQSCVGWRGPAGPRSRWARPNSAESRAEMPAQHCVVIF